MKKFFRIVSIIIVVVLIFAAIIASTTAKPSTAEEIWDTRTTVGNIEAKNHFVVYSDLVCPYCIAFENAVVEHEDDFQNYIADNDILYEVRISDFLYEYGEHNPINSRYSAVATYCALEQDKFWNYYNNAVSSVWNDYFEASGKSAVSSMGKLDKTYWINIGKQVGLGEDFESCVENDDTLDAVKANASRTAKYIHGMPYFKFNSFISSGYDLSWGWDYVLQYFQAGLESK